jgi:hypothetical protein
MNKSTILLIGQTKCRLNHVFGRTFVSGGMLEILVAEIVNVVDNFSN